MCGETKHILVNVLMRMLKMFCAKGASSCCGSSADKVLLQLGSRETRLVHKHVYGRVLTLWMGVSVDQDVEPPVQNVGH